jgi:hypothetical protein
MDIDAMRWLCMGRIPIWGNHLSILIIFHPNSRSHPRSPYLISPRSHLSPPLPLRTLRSPSRIILGIPPISLPLISVPNTLFPTLLSSPVQPSYTHLKVSLNPLLSYILRNYSPKLTLTAEIIKLQSGKARPSTLSGI